MAITLSHEVRGPRWGARVEFMHRVLFCSHTRNQLVNQGMGSRVRGPGCFPSQPAGLPHMANAAGRQAAKQPAKQAYISWQMGCECWQHQTSHGGRDRRGAGLWHHRPKCQPLVPPLSLERTSLDQDCPILSPLLALCVP